MRHNCMHLRCRARNVGRAHAPRTAKGIELYRCGSLLGYSMLPIVLFSALAVFLPARGGTVCTLGALATLWSSSTASSLLTAIVPALEVRAALLRAAGGSCWPSCCSSHVRFVPQGQRMLVAYPCALLYGLFALLTIG